MNKSLIWILLFSWIYCWSLPPSQQSNNETSNSGVNRSVLVSFYIARILSQVKWPGNARTSDIAYHIGIYGDKELAKTLNETFNDKNYSGPKISISIIKSTKFTENIDVLFINSENEYILQQFIDEIQYSSILTITSGHPNLCKIGIHINLYPKDKSLAIELNESALKKAGLRPAFILLQVSKIIDPIREKNK